MIGFILGFSLVVMLREVALYIQEKNEEKEHQERLARGVDKYFHPAPGEQFKFTEKLDE